MNFRICATLTCTRALETRQRADQASRLGEVGVLLESLLAAKMSRSSSTTTSPSEVTLDLVTGLNNR